LIRKCSNKVAELDEVLSEFEEMYFEPVLYAEELHRAWLLAGSLLKQVSGLVTIFVSDYETDDRYQMKEKLTSLRDSFEALGKPSDARSLSGTVRKSLLSAVGLALAEVQTYVGIQDALLPLDTAVSSSEKPAARVDSRATDSELSRRVFVVHGHDDAMKLGVARALEKLDFKPVILHEQPDKGRTLIEKFTDYSDVGFAVVLLSPDDVGRSRTDDIARAKSRPRQNVVLELGFFLGKLGRERVLALFKKADNFEMPSDFAGVLFKPFDNSNAWPFELVKELRACGYEVDANKLLHD
jgi:predicted nucleotide-binding protein